MNKKVLLLFFFLFLSQLAWSQKRLWPVVGIQPNISLHKTSFRIFCNLTVGLQSSRHTFSLGPVVFLQNLPSASEKPRISGLQTSYRYQLTKQETAVFRYFIELSNRFQSLREVWVSNYWNESLQTYQDAKQGSREYLWSHQIGVGFAHNLSKQLEFQMKTSAGYCYSTIKPEGDGSFHNSLEAYDYRFYRNNGLIFSAGVGLVFKFKDE